MYIMLVLSVAASIRCAEGIIDLLNSFFCVLYRIPSYWSGRLWLLQLGYYKLMREKEKAGDWVWIVDCSIQIGE